MNTIEKAQQALIDAIKIDISASPTEEAERLKDLEDTISFYKKRVEQLIGETVEDIKELNKQGLTATQVELEGFLRGIQWTLDVFKEFFEE